MAFMSIGEILKNIKSQGEILWKWNFLQRLSVTLPTVCGLFSYCIKNLLPVHRPVLTWCCHVQPCTLLIPTWPSWLGFPAWPVACLVTRDLSGGQSCPHLLFCLAGCYGTVAWWWQCCPVCLAVTLSSGLTAPCGATSSHTPWHRGLFWLDFVAWLQFSLFFKLIPNFFLNLKPK